MTGGLFRRLAEQVEGARRHAARIDDEGLPPQEVPPPRPVRAVGQPWAQAYLWPALSGSGSRDNIPDSFSGSFADAFSQDDDMVQAVSPDGTDQPFHVGPLPWTGWRGRDFRDAHSSDSFPKVTPIDFVSIPQRVTGCGIVWKRLNLSPSPHSGG